MKLIEKHGNNWLSLMSLAKNKIITLKNIAQSLELKQK